MRSPPICRFTRDIHLPICLRMFAGVTVKLRGEGCKKNPKYNQPKRVSEPWLRCFLAQSVLTNVGWSALPMAESTAFKHVNAIHPEFPQPPQPPDQVHNQRYKNAETCVHRLWAANPREHSV